MQSKEIIIQLDNASPHHVDNLKLKMKCEELKLNIRLQFQPSQSPDLNILDLGFFRSIQCLFYKKPGMSKMEHMVDAMVDCLDEYPAYQLNNAFLTLFTNYNNILQLEGDNDYKITHMSKEALIRQGKLPQCIKVIETGNIIEKFVEKEDEFILNIAESSDESSEDEGESMSI